MSLLRVTHIHKSFTAQTILPEISFEIDQGEIVCLLGPSGCGKTTLLRIIAGLETADSGEVTFNGTDLAEVPVHQRGFGLMFQDFALFPHKNVWDNVIFGLRMQHEPANQIQQQAKRALDLVGLTGFEKRDVNQLSGGERQRVALARSLAPQPKLLMLDEPLGSLDRKLREELMIELRRILKAAGLTSIYVTHDQQEAFAIADRVIVMNAGRLEQIGTPQEVYARPASEFVARFLGLSNLIRGTIVTNTSGAVTVQTPIGQLHVATDRAVTVNEAVTVLIRPDAADLNGKDEKFGQIEGVLIDAAFRGKYNRIVIRVNDIDLVFELDTHSMPAAIGQRVSVALHNNSIMIL